MHAATRSPPADGVGRQPASMKPAAAQASARRVLNWLIRGDSAGQPPDHYGYDERLPREEIIDEYNDESGTPHAFISRNSYGALILNTRDLMFIDIDLPPQPPPSPWGLIAKWFGKREAGPSRSSRSCDRQDSDDGEPLSRSWFSGLSNAEWFSRAGCQSTHVARFTPIAGVVGGIRYRPVVCADVQESTMFSRPANAQGLALQDSHAAVAVSVCRPRQRSGVSSIGNKPTVTRRDRSAPAN